MGASPSVLRLLEVLLLVDPFASVSCQGTESCSEVLDIQ